MRVSIAVPPAAMPIAAENVENVENDVNELRGHL